ncbi:MAG: endolytic transglycosylase MltG [Bacillales bacterium]|nr:endolytic transglycosylase MltG [Bacillales bacterium]
MSRETVRAFAFGLLSAALALFLFVQFFHQPNTSISTQDMIHALKKQGYTISSPEESNSQPIHRKIYSSKREKQQANSSHQTKNESFKEAANANRSLRLTISPGTTTDHIAHRLEQEKIINSASQFSEYMNQNGFSEKLQIGTYDINSQMTMEEIAKTITKSK